MARAALPREEQILLAAEQVFSRKGYARATLDEIIKIADVGKGTVYKYFGSKEQLFYTLVERKNTPFVAKLQAILTADETFEELLYRYLTELVRFFEENRAIWQIIFFELAADSSGRMVVHTADGYTILSRYDVEPDAATKERLIRYHIILESEFGILEELIGKGMRAGLLKNGDVHTIAVHIFFSTAMYIFHPGFISGRVSPEEGARMAVDRYLYGMAE